MTDITAAEYRIAVKVAKECCDQSTVEYLERRAAKAEAEFVCPPYVHGFHECNTVPAPAEPPEEARPHTPPHHDLDTGMTRITVQRACNRCGRDLVDATEKELDACVNGTPLPDVHDECGCDASPVVPAPTETGPWKTWQDVPEGVKYRSHRWPSGAVWFNRDSNRYVHTPDSASYISGVDDDDMNTNIAPFVAAEEGRA